jgi:hypothetical protein
LDWECRVVGLGVQVKYRCFNGVVGKMGEMGRMGKMEGMGRITGVMVLLLRRNRKL